MTAMAETHPQTKLAPGTGPLPDGGTPAHADEASPRTIVAALVALGACFYGFLAALYFGGSLAVGLLLRVSGFPPEPESWGHRIVHAGMVAGGVLLAVLLFGAAALLASRSPEAPPVPDSPPPRS